MILLSITTAIITNYNAYICKRQQKCKANSVDEMYIFDCL